MVWQGIFPLLPVPKDLAYSVLSHPDQPGTGVIYCGGCNLTHPLEPVAYALLSFRNLLDWTKVSHTPNLTGCWDLFSCPSVVTPDREIQVTRKDWHPSFICRKQEILDEAITVVSPHEILQSQEALSCTTHQLLHRSQIHCTPRFDSLSPT